MKCNYNFGIFTMKSNTEIIIFIIPEISICLFLSLTLPLRIASSIQMVYAVRKFKKC